MRRGGFALVLCLLLSALILVAGSALLTSRQLQYRWARSASDGLAARELARAGLEEARVKLMKDLEFPPAHAEDQPLFEYTEVVRDDDGTRLGSYSVGVDSSHVAPPFGVLVLTCVGRTETATRVLRAELDLATYRFNSFEEL